jgi:hypothetical protein
VGAVGDRPVEDTEITKIRRESQVGTRAQKRRGDAEVDEALVAPGGACAARSIPIRRSSRVRCSSGLIRSDAIHAFFAKRQDGPDHADLGEILSISGWDDEDVQEVEAARG